MHIYVYTYMHIRRFYKYLYNSVCRGYMRIRIYAYMHICIYAYMYIRIYAYMHICKIKSREKAVATAFPRLYNSM